jgi:hypothetical protein
MPQETSGEPAKLYTADHPPRTDSPEYIASRTWLTTQAMGGCVICGGESDLTHPGSVEPAAGNLQDHHGGGIYVVPKGTNEPVLVALNLFPIEWSEGWGADAVAPDPTTGGGTVVHVSQSARARSPKNAAENARLVKAWYSGKRDIRLPPDHNLVVAARKGAA